MDKFVKRIQTRANRQGISVTKQQVRDIYVQVVTNLESPTKEEMSLVIEKLAAQLQSPKQESISEQLAISTPEVSEDLNEIIPQPETFDIPVEDMPCLQTSEEQPQPTTENALVTHCQESQPTPKTALAKSEPSLPTQTTGGISEAEVTQAIAQAVQQVGENGNAEAFEMLTSLANELSSDISDTQEMVATLVAAYLSKRQAILSSAIGTLNTLRSAQTESFKSGLTNDFFGRKQKNKQEFISQVHATFN
jgi:hypothetical protein